jgi:hypothetical protein
MKKIKSFLLSIGGIIFFILATYIFVKIYFLGISFLFKLFPILFLIGMVLFLLNIFLFLPLSFFRKTDIVSGFAFFISSHLFGLLLLLYSISAVYVLWGLGGVIFGLLLGVIGVIPLALIASLLAGQWWLLLSLLLGIISTIGFRVLGVYLLSKYDEGSVQNDVFDGDLNEYIPTDEDKMEDGHLALEDNKDQKGSLDKINSKRFRTLAAIAVNDPDMEGIEIARKISEDATASLKVSKLVAIMRISKEIVDTSFQCSKILDPYLVGDRNTKTIKLLILEEFIYFFLHHFLRLAYEMEAPNRASLMDDVATWVFYSTIERIWSPLPDEQKDELVKNLYDLYREREKMYLECISFVSKISRPEELRNDMLLNGGVVNQLITQLVAIVFDKVIENSGHDLLFSKKVSSVILDVWIQKNEGWKDLIRNSVSGISFK